jgi:hypothetical protein
LRAADGGRLAGLVEPLAYTREQAAHALGISLATLDRRVVPTHATLKTEWGARLTPVRELERYLAERREDHKERRPPPPRQRSAERGKQRPITGRSSGRETWRSST